MTCLPRDGTRTHIGEKVVDLNRQNLGTGGGYQMFDSRQASEKSTMLPCVASTLYQSFQDSSLDSSSANWSPIGKANIPAFIKPRVF